MSIDLSTFPANPVTGEDIAKAQAAGTPVEKGTYGLEIPLLTKFKVTNNAQTGSWTMSVPVVHSNEEYRNRSRVVLTFTKSTQDGKSKKGEIIPVKQLNGMQRDQVAQFAAAIGLSAEEAEGLDWEYVTNGGTDLYGQFINAAGQVIDLWGKSFEAYLTIEPANGQWPAKNKVARFIKKAE